MSQNNEKQVSIVIPTFNRASYLSHCIESCLAQTHPCEIIVCDHGSTDETPRLMEKYKSQVRYIRREHDSGVHFCWLDGIISAKSDLIHINFDDDWILPTFIEECLQFFDDHVGFVISDATIYYEDKDIYSKEIFKINASSGIFNVKNIIQYNLKHLTSPCAGLYRRELLLENLFIGKVPFTKYEYKGVGPDLLFTLMPCLNYQYYGYVAKPLAVFRAHEGSITIDAKADTEKKIRIQTAYDEARIYFKIMRFLKVINIRYIVLIYETVIGYFFELAKLPVRVLSKIRRIMR